MHKKILILLVLIQVHLSDWLKLDSSFASPTISQNKWLMQKHCNCSDDSQESFNKTQCQTSINNLEFVPLYKDKQKLYKQYNYTNFEARMISDIFYINAKTDSDLIFSLNYEKLSSAKNYFYSKQYRDTGTTQKSNRICLWNNNSYFDLYTIVSTTAGPATEFNFTFCSSITDDGYYVGIRNVIVYANGCYPKCKTCIGANSNQCTSCFYNPGSVSQSTPGSCSCDPNHQFAETSIGCRAECSRDFSITNINKICVTDRRIKSSLTYFDANSISITTPRYQPFIFLPDSLHPQITDLIYDACNLMSFVGELFYNEGMQLQIGTINALQFIRLRLSFYLFSFQTNSKIQIFFDDVQVFELLKGSTGFISDSKSIIISSTTATCNSKSHSIIRIETIVRTQNLNPLIVIQGNLQTSGESWGFRNVTIDKGLCKENCLVCADFSTCSQCESTFKLYQNGCITQCPIHSQNCIDYVDEFPYSKYLIKGFYDLNMTYEEISSAFDSSSNPNTQTGQKFGFFPDKFVLGGMMVWSSGSYFKSFSITQPHYGVTIRFNITFGDQYPGSFYYKINSTSYGPITKPGGGQNLLARSFNEETKFIKEFVSHQTPDVTLNLEFQCIPTTSFELRNGFCAISEYFVVVHYCQPFCAKCSSATQCTEWQTGHTDSSCPSNTYISFDETTSTFSCQPCALIGCLKCKSPEECISCSSTRSDQYYLSNGVCYKTTIPDCSTGYFQNEISFECLPICGDQLIVKGEDCDDGNYNPFDGCDQCKYSCDRECNVCALGICESCIDGYELIENNCFAKCNDGILVSVEECEDNNLTPYDGCFNCKYQCSMHCLNCVRGVCQQCNESGGWYLQQDQTCQPICGDGIRVYLYEQCDDGNHNPYDQCSECQKSCNEYCDQCNFGLCSQCQSGYYLETKTQQCLSKCQDNIKTLTQVCDDENNIPFDGCYNCRLSCQPACTKCSWQGCEECEIGWRLNQKTCESICGDGLIVQDEECDDKISQNCFFCRFKCQESCLQCYQGKCKQCKTGWNLNLFEEYCYIISGNQLVQGTEQCDDSNLIDNDGCYQSQYSCQISCKICVFGQCQKCLEGYFNNNGKCYEIINDNLIVGYEICDDNNLIPFDGCFNNNYDCPNYCQYCINGQCQQCKQSTGYGYLDQFNNQCLSICGDGIVTINEDCDDKNTNHFDGCFECNYSCPQECNICQKGKCLQCNEEFYLNKINNQCISQCGDLIIRQNEECDDGNQDLTDGCAECKQICSEQCENCIQGKCMKCSGIEWEINLVIGDCQPICGVNGECEEEPECNTGYYADKTNLICLPICGDQLIVKGEDCDDGNYNPFDGCDQCKYSCDRECNVCALGICESCINGYELIENNCFAKCNDGILVSVEECEDNNQTPYDGCFNCKYQCSMHCLNCVRGVCQQCNESGGWYLQNDLTCQPSCGDGIIVSQYEQCDDGNDDPFDQCSQCLLSCTQFCNICHLGQCSQCQLGYYLESLTGECVQIFKSSLSLSLEGCYNLNQIPACTKCSQQGCEECEIGWRLNQKTCESICGDGLIVQDEECDDKISQNCFFCRFKCQESCLQCYQGKCKQCKTGWNLNLFEEYCYIISGNQLIQGTEQCDDSNLIDNDGCYQSQYSCQISCKICVFGQCQKCLEGYFNNNGKCYEIINDNIIVGYEICDDNNLIPFDGCFNNNYDCPNYCQYCINGQCQQCKQSTGYGYLDQFNNQCLSICGDGIVTINEDCDDKNTNHFDGCFECNYSCPQECNICQKGKCLQCNEGFYLNKINNQCISQCGDLIIRQNEECDDGNQDLTDGCAECKQICSEQCENCIQGKCMKCSGIEWEINLVIGDCQPICGDGVVVGYEQCDDGNDVPYDGCTECYFNCQKQCTKCVKGFCHECNTIGWELDWNYCIPTCGDGIVITELEECDDGNTIPYDGCFECKFQCEEQCTDCREGICYACENQGWKIANNVCYPHCGDGYVLPYIEECDDSNDIQFDGCFKCKYQCEQICTDCQSGVCYECDNLGWIIENHKCFPFCGDGLIVGYEQCDDQNIDQNDGCFNCMILCDQYCIDCQEGVCMECEAGRYLEQNRCQAICGDGYFVQTAEQCDDGNDENRDGCNVNCKVEKDWVCNNRQGSYSQCFYSQQPEFNLQLITSNPEDFEDVKITFTQQMKLSSKVSADSDIVNLIQADILNLENSGFLITKSFDNTPSNESPRDIVILLKVNFYIPVDEPILRIKFIDHPLVSQYNLTLKSSEGQLQLLTPMVLSQSEKAVAEAALEFNEAVIYTLISLSLLCLLTGSSDLFWNLMDQLQYLSYIKYINIPFPNNLNIYYEVFKLVTISPFIETLRIDKFFNWLDGDKYYYIPALNKFSKDSINAYFLTNFQTFLFVLFGGLSGYWVAKKTYLFLYQLERYSVSHLTFKLAKMVYKVKKNLKVTAQQFFYNGLLRILMSNCYDSTFACAIQLTHYKEDDTVLIINYYLAALVLVVQALISLVLFGIMNNFINRATFKKKSKFDALFEGVCENKSTWIMQYNSLLLIKKQIFIFLIVFMQQDGQIQTLSIALFQTIFLAYLFLNKPLANQYEYYKQITTEFLIIFNTTTFLFYASRVNLNLSLSDSINLGWIHIFTSSMILTVSLIVDLIQQFRILIQKLRSAIQAPQIERENTSVIIFY